MIYRPVFNPKSKRLSDTPVSKSTIMKNLITVIVLVLLFASCSRSVTPYEAANKHYKRCQSIR